MIRKAFLVSILALCLVICSLLASCSSDKREDRDDEDDEQEGDTTVASSEPETDEYVTVLFELHGGSVSYGELSVKVGKGAKMNFIATPDVFRDGYTFVGWAYDYEGNSLWYDTDEFYFDTTLFAVWMPNGSDDTGDGTTDTSTGGSDEPVTVLFELHGGSVSYGELSVKVEKGAKMNFIATPDVFRDGYTFVGWAYDYEGNSLWYDTDEFYFDTTLFAVWMPNGSDDTGDGTTDTSTGGADEPPVPKKVVIIFDGNGADIQDGNRVEIDYGSKLSFSLVPYLERDGYILKGWSYDPEGHYLLKPSRDTFTEDETVLYAVWERENTGGSDEPPAPKKVVIIFDGNGADIQDGNRVEIDYGSKLSFSLVPYLERDGYILKGWSYDPEGHYLLKPSRDTFTEDETVLYAVWERENTGDTTDSSDTSDTLPVHKHSYGGWVVVESPTCTETGLREKSCDCGDTVTEVIDATGHQYTDKVSKPTCIVQGYTTHECECGHSYVGEYVDATGHTEEMVEGRAPTCEEAGVTDGKKCSTCGEYTVPQEEISAKGHNYVKGVCSECQKEYSSVGLRYTLSEDGTYYTVSGGDCIDMDIFISSTYEGKPVKGIDSYAFYLHPEFRSVTMPNSITTIGAYAFHGCDELESINLSVELTEIGDFAFYGCDMLASIDIPSSVLSIGRSAFWGCDSLTSVAIHNGKIGVQAFASCAALKSASIGRGVTDIGQQAFYNCGKLETVTIPSNVSSVGLCAFEKCKNVTVYCEASKRPSGWHSQWNATFNIYDITNVTFCSVVWGADLDSMTNCS